MNAVKIAANIAEQIRAERLYQDSRWGTEFDGKNTINDWGTFIGIYLAKATDMSASSDTQRKQLLKVATLAVAALEAFDRNGGFAARHYDRTGAAL